MRQSFNVFLAITIILILFYINQSKKSPNEIKSHLIEPTEEYNVWIIFTKVDVDSPLRFKLRSLLRNLASTSSINLKYNLIVDKKSRKIAKDEFNQRNTSLVEFYDIEMAREKISKIVEGMMPHFTSGGSYYNDSLFYISLGLHLIASKEQNRAVMLDCDVRFKEDIFLLFKEFQRFTPSNLFGLAPELSPVYLHVLHKYRLKNKNSTFGDFYNASKTFHGIHSKGFQGYNSGVILLNLSAIRESKLYSELIEKENVKKLAEKFMFKGHLGDQDFYTLLGYEHPELIKTLNCGFNRQLCTWWRNNGYKNVFDYYFKCEQKIVILHGNCNAKIPTR